MTDRPLWRVMYEAYDTSEVPRSVLDKGCLQTSTLQWEDRYGYAAELRAIADEVERRGMKGDDLDPGETADWLRAEADRADAGEM